MKTKTHRDVIRLALVLGVVLGLMVVPAAGLVEITVPDAGVAEQASAPDASDPGPLVYTTSDGVQFSSGGTNAASAWYASLAATNGTGATSATMQGVVQTFTDWFYLKQNANGRFGPVAVTGVYDPNAGAYSVPLTFTKSSQGTLAFTSYSAAAPVDGGTPSTYYWAYNALTNRYLFGATKSLSGTQYAPLSDILGTSFAATLETNTYVIVSVAGAGANYVPTLRMGHHLPLLSLPQSHTYYALMDTPPGAHADTYTFTITMTAQGL